MISFRFYVISIVSFFLALSVGVVVGSALDDDLVKVLNNRIDDVDRNLERAESVNQTLKRRADEQSRYLDDLVPYAVDGALEGVVVVIVAERGAPSSAVGETADLVRAAGAIAPGVVWLEEDWTLSDDKARAELAAALDVSDADAVAMRSRAWRLVLQQWRATGALDGATTTTTTTSVAPTSRPAPPPPPATRPAGGPPAAPGSSVTSSTRPRPRPTSTTRAPAPLDALGVLADAGLVTFEGADGGSLPTDLNGRRFVVLHVGATETDVETMGLRDVVVSAAVVEGVPLLVAEADRDGKDSANRGDVVALVRGDAQLRESVATVDDVDLEEGQVAAVLALAQLVAGTPGHFGIADGASDRLPQFSEQ